MEGLTLIVNVGSSSIKTSLFGKGREDHNFTGETAFAKFLQNLKQKPPKRIGYRVVHGGKDFEAPAVLDNRVLKKLYKLVDLAPLHLPRILSIIELCRREFPKAEHYAVFDTSLHRNMPDKAKYYALPLELSKRHHIERFGFHGIAVTGIWKRLLEKHRTDKAIICHLGNGCSATAMEKGRSVDTSMGFSPLEGLMMGTRTGDIDPTVVEYLCEKKHLDTLAVLDLFNHKSGLLGVSGISSDMRELISQDPNGLAIELFCYRIAKTMGAFQAALKGCNCFVFSGGIGENAPLIREKVLEYFLWQGLKIDRKKNEKTVGLKTNACHLLTTASSTIQAFAIGSDENSVICHSLP